MKKGRIRVLFSFYIQPEILHERGENLLARIMFEIRHRAQDIERHVRVDSAGCFHRDSFSMGKTSL